MVKRFLLFLVWAVAVAVGHAQLPKWIVAPTYDTIYVKVDDCLLQMETNGTSVLCTMDGKQCYTTQSRILPFKDGVATIESKTGGLIEGFVDTQGKFTPLPNVQIAYGNPFFENGFLLCCDKAGFAFYDKKGAKAQFQLSAKAYPFHGGYAPYLTYGDFEKRKEPHYGYYRMDGKSQPYQLLANDTFKPVAPKDISFLSGIGTNGKGIAVIKNKVYWFNPTKECFEPFLWGEEESEKRRHLSVSSEYEDYFPNLPSDSVILLAKYGKNQMATLRFDQELRPTVFSFEDKEMVFSEAEEKAFSYSSELSSFGKAPYGIAAASRNVLPEQLDQVGLKYGNKIFVKSQGKWGILEVVPGLSYSLKLNKGEDVAFRHQKFETQIRLDLPATISAKEARIDIPEETGCLIDKTSRVTKDTESGNYVIYDCVLSIPESLPDTITNITYSPVKIAYDGLSLYETSIAIKAWHLKYYNVDPIESETSISNGVASFTININAQRNVGEGDYPFEVRIEAESVAVEYEKISETRYKCVVSNLQEGDNSLNILVTEKGCPPSVFPFEIFYTKPVPKKKKKEEVVIRKKSPVVPKHTPRLEI